MRLHQISASASSLDCRTRARKRARRRGNPACLLSHERDTRLLAERLLHRQQNHFRHPPVLIKRILVHHDDVNHKLYIVVGTWLDVPSKRIQVIRHAADWLPAEVVWSH